MRIKSILLFFLLLVPDLWLSSAQAQLVPGLALDQVTFTADHSGNVPCSEYGHASVGVRPLPGQFLFVQVMAQMPLNPPAWTVRNLPVIGAFSEVSTTVDLTQLGVRRGQCIKGSALQYSVTVTERHHARAAIFRRARPD